MQFDIVTIFPDAIKPLLESKIMSRALEKGIFRLNVHDLRDFTDDKHKVVDDVPFGGSAGMVLKPEPLVKALESAAPNPTEKTARIYLTPKGRLWNQDLAEAFATQVDQMVLVCGRYQGVDQRVIDGWIDEEISVGPYILGGGEIPAMVVVESVARLIPGVLGNPDSLNQETFGDASFEAPKYTRPRLFRNSPVPETLLSGDHARIEQWQRNASSKYQPKQRLTISKIKDPKNRG